MSILSPFSQPALKPSPDVWIHRVALLSKIVPAPVYIREVIVLRKGLNIIWAEEPESEDNHGDIAGHSAGKTTFCRILRYLLGERTFSNKANTQAIKKAFPNGYVAAELYIRDLRYAVLRPLGENRNSYVLKDGTIEEVIRDKGEVAFQDNYPSKLGLDRFIDDLATSSVVRTNEPIQWGHLLAWCARDQEARFQNIHEWRTTRSESEWPSFRFPKSDPLFVMRVALGLFLPDELESEKGLAELTRNLACAESEWEKAKREPEYWRDYYNQKHREQLTKVLPDSKAEIEEAPLQGGDLLPDLTRWTHKAVYMLGEKEDEIEGQIESIKQASTLKQEELFGRKNELKKLQTLFKVDTVATGELKNAQHAVQDAKSKIDEARDQLCPYGDVLIKDCSHVRERQLKLSPPGNLNPVADPKELELREVERKKVESQIDELTQAIKRLEEEVTELSQKSEALTRKKTECSSIKTGLSKDLSELTLWTRRADNPRAFEKMADKAKEIELLRGQIEVQQAALNQLITEHDENRDLLSKIFSASAKSVLPSAAYDGVVKFQDRELDFRITKKGTMSGEAMETLAVLLADLSCLVYNALSDKSRLPGIMIHDSPREADLGLRLYHGFISFVHGLEQRFLKTTECPFQYILTTTTPPPKTLRGSESIRLQLDASKQEGLLLKTDLSMIVDETDLFSI
jgi:hypothetical protein